VNTSNVFGPDSVIVSIFTFNQIRIERCVFSNCSVQNSNPSNIAGFIYVVSSSSVGFHNNVFSLCNIVGAGSFICCMKNNNSNSGDETSVLELSNEHYSQCRLSGVVIRTDYEIRLLMSSFSNLVSLLVEKESPSFPVSSLDPESGVLVSYSNIFITNSSFSNADGSYVILAYRDLTISDSWFKGTYSSIACLIIKSCFSVVSLKDLNFSSVSLGGGVIDLYGDDGYDKGLDLYGDDGYDKGQPSDDEDKLGGLSIRNCSLLDVVMTSYEDETLPGVFIRTRPSFLNSEAANEYLINLTSVYFSLTYELLPSMKINPVSLIDVKNVDFFIGNSELSNVISGSINSIRNSDENSTNTVLFAWSSAAVLTFSNCTTELRNVTIHSQRGLGAVSSVGIHSKLKLYNQYINSENETSLFDTSQGLSDSFSSAGMNVYCEGGGGLEVDGEREWSDGISLWIDNVDCAVVGKIVDYPSLLFVPSLKQITAEYAELPTEISENKTLEKEVKISYFGKDLFIHPDIKFAVGYRIKSERKEEYTEIILNEIVIINETFATHLFESNVFYIDKLEEEELEWVGWINFSNDYHTKIISISFLDAPPDDDGSASFIYPPLSQVTLIGIFVIGGLMVIIILFIIYALISKKLKKWWKNKNKEMLEENDNVDEKNTGIENLVDGDYVKQT
jgi:hypothetical protein